jgi:hypothetical protein
MKKIMLTFLALITMFMSCIASAGCAKEAEVVYNAKSDFFYSRDNGLTYGNGRVMFDVGEDVLLRVVVHVQSTSLVEKTVQVTLTFPDNDAVVCQYESGQKVEPIYFPNQKITKYNFVVDADKNSEEHSFTFCLSANAQTEMSMILEFDDNVDSSYNRIETICFVE